MPLIAINPIESARLCVRPVSEPDLPALLEVNGNEEVSRFLPYAAWKSMSDAQAWLKRMADLQAGGSALQFVIALKQTGIAIGTCLLFKFEEADTQAEIGYVLGRAHWGQGYMREALTALIDCAFNCMSLRRLEAAVESQNAASTRLLRGLGFTREGVLRERWITKRGPMDAELFGLLRREWVGRAAGHHHP